jgi:predicted nucleic acid-binding protein
MGLSCLTDPAIDIVADASTLINLNASGQVRAMVSALPNALLVTDVVLGELQEDSRSGRRDAHLLSGLISEGLVRLVKVEALKEGIFQRLVSGRSIDTLDDGEAATIAYAVEARAMALIDERKANRICRDSYPQLVVGCTVDVLCHDQVQEVLTPAALGQAVFDALQGARMRVLQRHLAWVVDMIGPERAVLCESLPRSVRLAKAVDKATSDAESVPE